LSIIKNTLGSAKMVLSFNKGQGWTEGILAIMLIGVWLYMMATQQTSPVLDGIAGLIVGLYFGNKTQQYRKEIKK